MRVKEEIITILAITRMHENKVCISGINEEGRWVRIKDFYLKDLGELKLKIYDQVCFDVLEDGGAAERPEDEIIFLDDRRKPKLIREVQGDERICLIEKHLEPSVQKICSSGRTLGLIKPIIENIKFHWDSYANDFVARFSFEDQIGKKYDYPCLDIFWRQYWTNYYRLNNEEIENQLLHMLWQLNDQETYFLVGLTQPFVEMPGPVKGSWPVILAVHTFSLPDYIKDYNT